MRNPCLLALTIALALTAACGPSSKPAPADPGGGGATTPEEPGERQPGGPPTLTPAMTAFQATLTEVRDAEPGDARNAMACDAGLTALADDIEAEGTPAGVDAGQWAQRLDGLRMALNDLDGPCTGGTTEQGAMPVPDALDRIHEAFGGLVGALPAS